MVTRERLLRGGDAVLSDLDGVVHHDLHGVGLKTLLAIAEAGYWDGRTNKNGHHGTLAAELFNEEVLCATTPREHDELGHKHLFDFVDFGSEFHITKEDFRRVMSGVIARVADESQNRRLVSEIAVTARESGKPAVFITFSPLMVAQGLVSHLFPNTPHVVFSPWTQQFNGDMMRMERAYRRIEALGKGEFAKGVMADLAIDPSRTTGFGDTMSDASLLSILARPFAVTPTGGLEEYAREHDIPVLDFADVT